jgi:hypothetical protein
MSNTFFQDVSLARVRTFGTLSELPPRRPRRKALSSAISPRRAPYPIGARTKPAYLS